MSFLEQSFTIKPTKVNRFNIISSKFTLVASSNMSVIGSLYIHVTITGLSHQLFELAYYSFQKMEILSMYDIFIELYILIANAANPTVQRSCSLLVFDVFTAFE